MLAVQKPPIFHLPTAPYAHRRHPSAPVLVHATRTPGLLSMSRLTPPRSTPVVVTHRPPPRSSPRARPAVAAAHGPTPTTPVLQPAVAAEISTGAPSASSTPSKLPRGRQQTTHKPSPRSISQCSPRGRRSGCTRSPDSSQAEAQQQDPFSYPFVRANFSKDAARTLTLAPKPSGKLARRRQHNAVTIALPIPVPGAAPFKNKVNVARSQPTPSISCFRSVRVSRFFPICDDTTDAASDSDIGESSESDSSFPSTPASSLFDSGACTAPLSGMFDFPPSPTPGVSIQSQMLADGDGVFDISLSSSDEHAPPDLSALCAAVNMDKSRVKPSSTPFASYARRIKWASSTFQNSPSPEELPPPSL
ncbi:hypothetical protein FISHEDRAFT_69161 [Fistulina hepatica ATCC 64428]|uniref:Uncharacterized protein n=1 Tax=Fistulina hepatica ATCC 64428 TaxID=1128425 RepID=A0A0D7ANJ2_9AGAR|nr:hypothetical protein FISHEDRAFT_69161 [Fistulina hepatica ATCC 64428]